MAAYLLGPQTPRRLAQLAAALALYGDTPWANSRQDAETARASSAVRSLHFDAYLDTLLPGWRHYKSDAEKANRIAKKGGPRPSILTERDVPRFLDEDGARESWEAAVSRLAGGAPDHAPELIARLAFDELPKALRHIDHAGAKLTGAQKSARHRRRTSYEPAANPYLRARAAWQSAARAAGLAPEPCQYRKPQTPFVPRLGLTREHLPLQTQQERGWSARALADANLAATRAAADVRALFGS